VSNTRHPGPFRLVAEPSVLAAQPGGRGKLADQRVTFGVQGLALRRAAGRIGVSISRAN